MKKRLLSLLTLLAAIALISVATVVPAFAESGDLDGIAIHCDLDREGNGRIVEIWQVDVPDDWTEMYIVKGNLGKMKITDLQVTDLETGKNFTYTGSNWDIDRSRKEKANKCGTFIDDDGALELCWGVGSSGLHRYQVSYNMSNMVQSFEDDCDGFNIRFVNDGLSSPPEAIKITISADDFDFTRDDTKFWAFGLEGNIAIDNGDIVVTSEEHGYINYVNLLCQFTDSKFSPNVSRDIPFKTLKETAFENSDYESGNVTEDDDIFSDESSAAASGVGLFIVGMLVFVFTKLIGAAKVEDINVSSITRAEKKNVNYCRELPFDGDINTTYTALKLMNEENEKGNIMSAYILKWIKNGYITVHKEPPTGLKALLSSREEACFTFSENFGPDAYGIEGKLWLILRDAAGKDGILQEKEFEKWSNRHYSRIEEFFDAVESSGKNHIRVDCCTNIETGKLIKRKDTVLTPEGKRQFLNVLGFRKYLKEFTIINEREAKEVELWGEYLVYATLYGIADEVADEFKKILPDYFDNPNYGVYGAGGDFTAMDYLLWINLANSFSQSSYNGYHQGISAAEMHTASMGGGGFTSFGGGGGFSGGGTGGGGR